jgi:hypothetical protein
VNAHSQPPSRIKIIENSITPVARIQKGSSNLPPKLLNSVTKNASSLPELRPVIGKGKKHAFLISLREENNRIRNELKLISKQLTIHINRQLRDKSNFNADFEKELKFLEGNLTNANKRLEIVEYEFEQTKYLLRKDGKMEKHSELRDRLRQLNLQ